MVFNSLLFIPFFLLVTAMQYLPVSWTARKVALTLFSYAFYAAWYPPTIVLLWLSTLLDWTVTHGMMRTNRREVRRLLLLGSILLNLGLLGFFKYGAFLVTNLTALSEAMGYPIRLSPPDTVLPVGISFYTFMSLAYVIDVYRGVTRPGRSFLDFALFLTFYPHLVAGPIVRSQDFLPQCAEPRKATSQQFAWGVSLLLLGLFEKVVVADALLAPATDRVFAPGQALSTLDAWIGVLAFSGQIFCDFAGYSTCAIGAAACLGFMLPENFRRPYAALGFSDFWRRWHITLSAWLRDYLYVSLGGNRSGSLRTMANLMLTMLLGGLWHGASWTFVIWGALHGAFLVLERGYRSVRESVALPAVLRSRALGVVVTFLLVSWAWVFFRAPDFGTAWSITQSMAGFGATKRLLHPVQIAIVCITMAGVLLFQNRFRDHSLPAVADRTPTPVLVVGLCVLMLAIVTISGEDRAFIYFQF